MKGATTHDQLLSSFDFLMCAQGGSTRYLAATCRAVSSLPSDASTQAPFLTRNDTASAWLPKTAQCSAVLPPAERTLTLQPSGPA